MSSFQYISYLNSIASSLLYYPVLAALPIGVVGNLFSFFIYTRPNLNKKTNTGFLYAWLCILNLLFMLYYVLVVNSSQLFNYNISLPCGVMNYIFRITFCFAPWMQVIISFDRFIAVVYPLKKHIMEKKWVLYLIMLGTLALTAAANIPIALQYVQTSGRFSFCAMTTEVTVAASILAILSRAYVPFSLILAFDIIVFKRLRKSKRRVGVIKIGQRKQPGEVSNREYSFIISTILIDLTFIIFYTPVSAYISITVVDIYINWDRLTGAGFNIFYSCSILSTYLYSVWLLLIFFIFNRYFRNEVFAVLRINKLFPSLNQTLMQPTESKLNNITNRSIN